MAKVTLVIYDNDVPVVLRSLINELEAVQEDIEQELRSMNQPVLREESNALAYYIRQLQQEYKEAQ